MSPMDMNAAIAAESSRREALAAYFLSVPSRAQQTPAQQEEFDARLRELGQLETEEILQNAGIHRPLMWGNPVPLMQHLLTAIQRLAAGLGQPVLVFPAKETAISFDAMLHPRILSFGLAGLLRVACLEAPHAPVWVRMQEQEHCLTVTVAGAAPFPAGEALRVAQESARLHKGSLALSENTVAFSIGRAETAPTPVHPYHCSTAEELLRDSLSPVWTGFYAWLSGSGSDESSTVASSSAASSDSVGEAD